MQFVLGESSSTSLSADRANSCTVPELLQGPTRRPRIYQVQFVDRTMLGYPMGGDLETNERAIVAVMKRK